VADTSTFDSTTFWLWSQIKAGNRWYKEVVIATGSTLADPFGAAPIVWPTPPNSAAAWPGSSAAPGGTQPAAPGNTPTTTPTPTHTPTATITPTQPTATATRTLTPQMGPNLYCAANDVETTVLIATGTDDGEIQRVSTGAHEYPPSGPMYFAMATVDLHPIRSFHPDVGYQIWNAFWRWNVSLPSGAVTQAFFVPQYDSWGSGTNICLDGLGMILDWHVWSGSAVTASDYAEAPVLPSHVSYAATKACGTIPPGPVAIALTHLSHLQNGYVGLRAQMEILHSPTEDAPPTGLNQQHIHPIEDSAPASLVICSQSSGTPSATVTGIPTPIPTSGRPYAPMLKGTPAP
jgi:hypothetical protein